MNTAYVKIRRKYYSRMARLKRWGAVKKMAIKGGFSNGKSIVPYHPPEEGNDFIRRALAMNKPFMAARYGTYELMALAKQRFDYSGKGVLKRLCFNAGFFPEQEHLLEKYAEVYADAARYIDCFAAWNFRLGLWKYEELAFSHYSPEAYLTDIGAIKFIKHADPWTAALEGKRVLVVHPFAETIERQYEKRDDLFPGTKVLPEFALLDTLKAVQSAAGSIAAYDTWFDALDSMREMMERFDFEVALIGAGAYGFPLAAHAKRLGKQAIHMGGVTQMLFGIMGRRWESAYGHLVNDAWTRPADHEIPPKFESVEGGCYW